MKKKILFIEDEEDHVNVIRMRLEAAGYELITALAGREGLELARKEKPDLILLDLMLPEMDGYEVCKHLKANTDTRNIPVIIITASGDKNLDEKIRKSGADALIRKPYESTDLLNKIKALLQK